MQTCDKGKDKEEANVDKKRGANSHKRGVSSISLFVIIYATAGPI